jgi:hypothetical protein
MEIDKMDTRWRTSGWKALLSSTPAAGLKQAGRRFQVWQGESKRFAFNSVSQKDSRLTVWVKKIRI